MLGRFYNKKPLFLLFKFQFNVGLKTKNLPQMNGGGFLRYEAQMVAEWLFGRELVLRFGDDGIAARADHDGHDEHHHRRRQQVVAGHGDELDGCDGRTGEHHERADEANDTEGAAGNAGDEHHDHADDVVAGFGEEGSTHGKGTKAANQESRNTLVSFHRVLLRTLPWQFPIESGGGWLKRKTDK